MVNSDSVACSKLDRAATASTYQIIIKIGIRFLTFLWRLSLWYKNENFVSKKEEDVSGFRPLDEFKSAKSSLSFVILI